MATLYDEKLARSVREEITRSMSNHSLNRSLSQSASKRSWASASIHEVWSGQGDVFKTSQRENDEEELKWAAIERLPTYDRLKKGILKQVLDNGKVNYEEIDVSNLTLQDKK